MGQGRWLWSTGTQEIRSSGTRVCVCAYVCVRAYVRLGVGGAVSNPKRRMMVGISSGSCTCLSRGLELSPWGHDAARPWGRKVGVSLCVRVTAHDFLWASTTLLDQHRGMEPLLWGPRAHQVGCRCNREKRGLTAAWRTCPKDLWVRQRASECRTTAALRVPPLWPRALGGSYGLAQAKSGEWPESCREHQAGIFCLPSEEPGTEVQKRVGSRVTPRVKSRLQGGFRQILTCFCTYKMDTVVPPSWGLRGSESLKSV